MKQLITTGMVLARTDFQEADRILTLLTPDHGKVRVIAKGVRRPKSKLAGGIELFSVSNIAVLLGRGDLSTLISSRLITHYGNIVKDIQRTMLGYELLKRMNRLTEDAAGGEYFEILQRTLTGLDNLDLSVELAELWFTMQLLKVTGHAPNFKTDVAREKLQIGEHYSFEFDAMAFQRQPKGPFNTNHIKLLRLYIGTARPELLAKVQGADKLTAAALMLANSMLNRYVRV